METKEIKVVPIAMKCTKEQYLSIKPILDINGFKNEYVYSQADTYLVNKYPNGWVNNNDIEVRNVFGIDADKFNRKVYNEWNYNIFLNSCGIKTYEDILKDTPFHKPDFHKPDFNHWKDIDKYLDEKAKNSGLNKTPIEELEAHFKEPKLYSVLLSLGKMRMVYIDQTYEDVEQIKKQSPNWHTIIIEQQQDKGIQIIIKS
jgi:hypothetical protein